MYSIYIPTPMQNTSKCNFFSRYAMRPTTAQEARGVGSQRTPTPRARKN